MRRVLVALILLALLGPSALAATATEVAAEYEAELEGDWICVSGGNGFDDGDEVTFGATEGERFFVGASASGTAYLYYTDGGDFWTELGEITMSADGQVAIIYKSGARSVLERE